MMRLRTLFSYDFRHTAINQLWRLLSGPLLLMLVPLYLSAEVQGYWYTFVSLAALAVFADMGFSAVLLLFSSHEFAHLELLEDKTLAGSEEHLTRLATLWRFSIKWSVGMALVVFPLVLMVGFVVLTREISGVNWQLPWGIYTVASVFVFTNSMILSFIEGCDSVGDAQKIRFYISVVTVGATIGLLVAGAGLYSLALALLVGALSGVVIILHRYRCMLLQLQGLARNKTHPWFKEIMPLIWRYAVSWVSGYFMFQVFTPIAFHYFGPVEAGQVGLSIAICTAIFGVANVWITIIAPKINILVARQDYLGLDSVFKKHLFLALLTYLLGMAVLFAVVTFFKDIIPFARRLVGVGSLFLVSVGWLLQLIVGALAIYVRAHKKEPLAGVSFANGVYVCLATMLIARYMGFDFLFLGFISGYLIMVPWVVIVFKEYSRH